MPTNSAVAPTTLPPPLPPKRPELVQLECITAPRDYKGERPEELSFEEGDVLYIVNRKSANSFVCRKGQQEGIVPASILENYSSIEFPVHEAAKRGNAEFLKELVSARVSVNTLDKAGNSPSHWAARGGHLECLKLLMVGKPVLSQQNKLGDTVLHSAAWGGHPEIVSFLLQLEGINEILELKNGQGMTAYQVAKNAQCAGLLQPREMAGKNYVEDDQDSD